MLIGQVAGIFGIVAYRHCSYALGVSSTQQSIVPESNTRLLLTASSLQTGLFKLGSGKFVMHGRQPAGINAPAKIRDLRMGGPFQHRPK
jgi:hypothetical protein